MSVDGEVRGTYLRFPEQTEKLTTLNEVHDHVQVLGVLESTPKSDEEGVLDLLEHPPLIIGVLNLLHLDDLGLFQHLHSVETLVVLGLHKVDSAEAAGTECPADCEIGEGVFALGLAHGVRRGRAGEGGLEAAIGGEGRLGLRGRVDDVLNAGSVVLL